MNMPLPQWLTDWITETLNRLFIKQPKYFKYWSWLSYAGMGVSGVPYLLTWFGVELSEPFATLSNKFVTGVSVAMYWMSKLAVKTAPVAQTETGEAIKITDDKKMPFTSKSEAKDVDKTVPPPPVVPEVPNP